MRPIDLQSRNKWASVPAAMVLALTTCLAHAADAPVAGDSYVNSAYPTTNYGTLTNLYVGGGGTAFIQFDLSSLPAGTTSGQIGKATLRVFVNRVNTSGLVTVQAVTGSWTESGVTYATMPTLGSTVASFTPAVADQFILVDVTSLVQGWVTSQATNFGLALSSATGNVVLDSKESQQTSHAATLDITIVSQGPTGPTGAQGPQGIPGIAGATGPMGAAGATGATGPIGATGATGSFTSVVPYESATTYTQGAVVSCVSTCATNGSSFYLVSASPVTGSDPSQHNGTSGQPWIQIAAVGATGPVGPTGATGTQGPQGFPGFPGPIGPIGAQGPQGIQGFPGATGPVGPIGATGATGAIGATGATGTFTSVVSYDGAATYTQGSVVSCVSTCATNGSSYYLASASPVTASDPSQHNGISGQPWIQMAAAGATGPTGPAGAMGAQGAQGFPGPIGPTGALGPQGPQGLMGAQGNTGATGPAGPAGSGLTVKDANGNSLGTLVGGGYGTAITIYKSGYLITVNVDGTFPPSQIWWSNGASCSGTGYLNDGQGGAGGVQSAAKTVVWSSAMNGWFVTSGTATKGVVTSESGVGTTSAQVANPPYASTTTYFSPDFSIENSGNTDGSYACSTHQAYAFNGSSYYLVTKSNPESGGYGLGYSGWILSSFDTETTLGWPALSSCSVTVYPGYDGATGNSGSQTTANVACLAGPLQLP